MAKRKEERLPKGFGGVVFMKGNRAKPYVVRIKVGTTINEEKGTAYPKYKIKSLVMQKQERMVS